MNSLENQLAELEDRLRRGRWLSRFSIALAILAVYLNVLAIVMMLLGEGA